MKREAFRAKASIMRAPRARFSCAFFFLSCKSICRRFNYFFNCRQLLRTSGPHQHSALNKKLFEKLSNRRCFFFCVPKIMYFFGEKYVLILLYISLILSPSQLLWSIMNIAIRNVVVLFTS